MSGVNVDNLIRQAGDNGWQFFEGLVSGGQARQTLSPEIMAKAQKLAHVWANFYGTDGGREVIDHLVETTLGRATFIAQLGLPMDAAYGFGCQREGQNGIVFMVLKMIAEGRKDQPPPERTET